MFPEVRRKDRVLPTEKIEKLLMEGEYGVLSTIGEEYPYGVPISYAYDGSSIYIHCATVGTKLNNLFENTKVSFCIVGKTQVLSEDFTTNYESVVVFGTAEEVFEQEKQKALELLLDKYSSEFIPKGLDYIEKAQSRVKVIKILPAHITGKGRK